MKLLWLALVAFIVLRVLPGAGRKERQDGGSGDDALGGDDLGRALRASVYEADAARAVRLGEQLLASMAEPDMKWLNQIACAFVFGGRYREALALPDRFGAAALKRARKRQADD